MGHALFLTIQDSLNRYYKLTGRESLWLPGLDHAGLATHEKILNLKNNKKISYKEASLEIESSNKETILNQIKKTGVLPDWRFLTYTLEYDELLKNSLKLMKHQGRLKEKDGQTFLDLKDYAKELLSNLNQFNIIPSKKKKDLIPFLEDYKEWNISRDIPWGSKLLDNPSQSLDTWFNSSFWCIATLNKYPDLLDKFYPADILETGADILFFWCARMLIISHWCYDNQKELGINLKEKYCFNTIYLHGIIRDKNGEKMSKSLGNGIDPLDIIQDYNCDAMRLFLITRTGPAEDIIFDDTQLKGYRNFINKIFQSGRFFAIYASKYNINKLSPEDIYYLKDKTQLDIIINEYIYLMENFKFLEASRLIQSKFKLFFCDHWLEQNKSFIQEGNEEYIKNGILMMKSLLLMLSPFCPFIGQYLLEHFFILDNK